MSSYFIAQINIHTPDEYENYLQGYDDIFNRYQGTVLAVDEQTVVLEGDWPYQRTVVIQFPDKDALLCWYRSSEYQALARHRLRASEANIVMVNGRKE